MRSTRSVLLPGVFVGAAIASGCTHAHGAAIPPATLESTASDVDLAVYALSRGKGVPDPARQALAAARELFARWGAEGRVLDLVDTPMGIEGDTRVCARFATAADAEDALRALATLGRGVELFQVRREPCTRTAQ